MVLLGEARKGARNDPPENAEERWWHQGGESFLKWWVNNETHYALERKGFVYDYGKCGFIEDTSRFGRCKTFLEVYTKTRKKVLTAVVKRGIQFLEERDVVWSNGRDYNEQFSCSLEKYCR